jgi:hypothetical protein
MSLVNDALKRATEVHKKNSPPILAEPGLKLRPVDPAPSAKNGIGLVLPVTLLTIVAIGILSLIVGAKKGPVVSAQTKIMSVASVAPIAEIAVQPAATTPVPVAAETAPPVLAPLKLQAVFYTPPKPTAIISGETVHVGDSVREWKVVAIGSASAMLIGSAQTNFLTLE